VSALRDGLGKSRKDTEQNIKLGENQKGHSRVKIIIGLNNSVIF
jgi:hypothetical protein